MFPLAIQKIINFIRNNPGISVNVLLNNKEIIYIAYRSELNGKCSKQANLLMIVDGENRHYKIIKKKICRLLSRLNGKRNRTYHFCINCLDGFRTASAIEKPYEYCSSNGYVNVKMPSEKE